jgi:D-alanyl-D-alanine carboxypeptidase
MHSAVVVLNALLVATGFMSPFLILKDVVTSVESAFEENSFLSGNREEEKNYLLSATEPNFPIRNWAYDIPAISARSAVSFEAGSQKILYQKEFSEKLPIASLTKLMTAVAVLAHVALNETVTVSESALKESYALGSDSRKLAAEEAFRAEDLLKLMLIESNNEAAFAFKEFLAARGVDLVAEMNSSAVEIGMMNTRFNDPAGLDDRNGFSTAEDVLKLVQYSLRYDIIHQILRTPQEVVYSADYSFVHRLFTTNRLLGLLPNLITGKTGYTEEALGSMVVVTAAPNGSTVITVVLGSRDRFGETRRLVAWVNEAYLWH